MARQTLAQAHNELTAAHEAQAVEISALKDAIAAADASVAKLAAERDEAVARCTALAADVAAKDAAIAEAVAKADAAHNEAVAARAEVETLKSTLALTNIPDIAGTDPVADGGDSKRTDAPTFTRAQIAAMPPAEYRKNRAAIMDALTNMRIK